MKHAAKLRIIFCSNNSKSKNTQRYMVFYLCRVSFYAQKKSAYLHRQAEIKTLKNN
nr:MAG TPA: hypothetical protein [Caudoviricetes sp.]